MAFSLERRIRPEAPPRRYLLRRVNRPRPLTPRKKFRFLLSLVSINVKKLFLKLIPMDVNLILCKIKFLPIRLGSLWFCRVFWDNWCQLLRLFFPGVCPLALLWSSLSNKILTPKKTKRVTVGDNKEMIFFVKKICFVFFGNSLHIPNPTPSFCR